MGNMQAGLETLCQQLCSPGSCHSVGLAILAGHSSNPMAHCFFWTPRSGPPENSRSQLAEATMQEVEDFVFEEIPRSEPIPLFAWKSFDFEDSENLMYFFERCTMWTPKGPPV